MAWWIALIGTFGLLMFIFACCALYRISPGALKVQVKVSPWSISASVEMGGYADKTQTSSLHTSPDATSADHVAALRPGSYSFPYRLLRLAGARHLSESI